MDGSSPTPTHGTVKTTGPGTHLPSNKKTPPSEFSPTWRAKNKFVGGGINILFRPNNGVTGANTCFPTPVSPPPPQFPNNNVLEINLFEETLTFTNAIGHCIPNRGFNNQGDIGLNGIMYLQTISDVSNQDTGQADGNPCPIHAENGMLIRMPAISNDPAISATINRLGSIPHGVSINLQGFEPTASATVSGPPDITHNPSLTTPFQIMPDGSVKLQNDPAFPSLTAAKDGTARIPQNLDKFVTAGTITDALLADPTQLLSAVNQTRNILSTITLTMSSTNGTTPSSDPDKPKTEVPTGGGVIGNAFLAGDATGTKANAFPYSVDFTLWIETVRHSVTVPTSVAAKETVEVVHDGITFVLSPPRDVKAGATVDVQVTELQYSQMVLLQFGVLTWPHPSVSTLKPPTVTVGVDHIAWTGL
ncbi:hypothetical protein QBC43DRAFT_211679 [Cladorrhinum sp. PSN259]|nr:hypothetical protein QBC43DRAFT_211679 [Cladorrhinum sp. PSN259]